MTPPVDHATAAFDDANGTGPWFAPDPERTMSEALAALCNKLPAWRELLRGPCAKDRSGRELVSSLVVMLRREPGWTPEAAIELATLYPNGLGILGPLTAKAIKEIWNELDAAEAEAGRAKAEIVALSTRTSAAALLARELPPEECLLGSLIPRGSRSFLVGSTGIGKTMLGLAMAGGMSSGTGFLNWRAARRSRVL
jgi:hypothetical protein